MMRPAAVICAILICLNSISMQHNTSDPVSNFTADAIKIKRAIELDKEWSEQAIIDILVESSNDQRQEIKKAFLKQYNIDLVKELNRFFFYDTRETIVTLMVPNKKFNAYQLRHAIQGIGTDENAISQILGSMNMSEISETSSTYLEEYGVTLKEDLESDTSGPFKSLLVSLCDVTRNENDQVDKKSAVEDAIALNSACKYAEDKFHADETVFITILTTRSRPQLELIFREYATLTNKTIIQTIKKEFKGETQYCFLIIVKSSVLTTSHFYAAQLDECMEGYGTDDQQLIRIIVGRSEIDLNDIKQSYEMMYGVNLIDKVYDETSGNYRKLLLAILHK